MTSAAAAFPASGVASDLGLSLEIPYPQKTSRLLALVRGVLVMPHYVVLIFRLIGAFVMTYIVGFWCVLLLGRPAAYEFNTGVMRYVTRINAYVWLLTDQYPPFSKAPGDYAIQLDFPDQIKIGRWRCILTGLVLLPHFFLRGWRGFCAAFVMFAAWVMILISGKFPEHMFSYIAKVTRYKTVVASYQYFLIAEYPSFSLEDYS